MRPASRLAEAQPIYRTAEIRAIEEKVLALDPRLQLMERAGEAAALLAKRLLGEQISRVLVLAGPGNNGGDAFVVARHLKRWWSQVDIAFFGDPHKLLQDANQALKMLRDAGGTLLNEIPAQAQYELVIDGLFGIGLARDIEEPYRGVIERVNELGVPVLALDVPSGLDSDTGVVRGAAVRATHTITFIGLKPGLLTLEGPDHVGHLYLDPLGLTPEQFVAPPGRLLDEAAVRHLLAPRRKNSHKGHFGNVGIIGGEAGMVGAALLAGRAAIKLGAGRVFIGLAAMDAPKVDLLQPELMVRHPVSILEHDAMGCLVLGPGFGDADTSKWTLEQALDLEVPLVLDADALNLIARNRPLVTKLREPRCILADPASGRGRAPVGRQDRASAVRPRRLRAPSRLALQQHGRTQGRR
jgi:ADP-dependent NAD(P)H-hydrate dehydratase / NAD(P)H-hydrate epimerase